jgi:cbb3-type cytochrome oxidase subunit 3
LSIEDRIEQLSRLALVILLIATLGWASQPKARIAAQRSASLNLAAKPAPRDKFMRESRDQTPEEPSKRAARRTSTI